MSLARLGISFSIAGKGREVLIFTAAASGGCRVFSLEFDCVFGILFFILHFCLIKLRRETGVCGVCGTVFTPKNRCL